VKGERCGGAAGWSAESCAECGVGIHSLVGFTIQIVTSDFSFGHRPTNKTPSR